MTVTMADDEDEEEEEEDDEMDATHLLEGWTALREGGGDTFIAERDRLDAFDRIPENQQMNKWRYGRVEATPLLQRGRFRGARAARASAPAESAP